MAHSPSPQAASQTHTANLCHRERMSVRPATDMPVCSAAFCAAVHPWALIHIPQRDFSRNGAKRVAVRLTDAAQTESGGGGPRPPVAGTLGFQECALCKCIAQRCSTAHRKGATGERGLLPQRQSTEPPPASSGRRRQFTAGPPRSVRFAPGVAPTHVYYERHVELHGVLHRFAHQRLQLLALVFSRLEHQLVVNSQDHA